MRPGGFVPLNATGLPWQVQVRVSDTFSGATVEIPGPPPDAVPVGSLPIGSEIRAIIE